MRKHTFWENHLYRKPLQQFSNQSHIGQLLRERPCQLNPCPTMCYLHVLTKGQGKGTWAALSQKFLPRFLTGPKWGQNEKNEKQHASSLSDTLWSIYLSIFLSYLILSYLNLSYLMSASHEKSPTVTTNTLSTPQQHKHPFVLWVAMPACATLACWLAKPNPDKSGKIVWSHQMDQIPAAPTGLAVGTNPPSLPSEQTVGDLARAPWVDRLIHFVVEPPNCRWNGVIHQAEEQSCQPLTVKLCACHTIGAHLVDPPFIPSSGYLVLPLCRQYFDPQMGLGHVGLQQQPLVVLGWPVPMVIRELTPSKFCLRGLSPVGAARAVQGRRGSCPALAPPQEPS